MPRKASFRFKIAPLQRVVAEPITDPEEIAALDRARERERRKKARQEADLCIDDFLDHVDEWKGALNEKLERMTPAQRQVFWEGIHEVARQWGLPIGEFAKPAKPRNNRRRSG